MPVATAPPTPPEARDPSEGALTPAPLVLSVVVPTFNEGGNVAELVRRLHVALAGVEWRVVFVDDDSPDGTAEAVKALALTDPRVSCIRRVGRRGLAGAVVEGALASAAPYLAVLDADLQHDETLLPQMLRVMRDEAADLVIASRYVARDAPAPEGLSPMRRWGSRMATRVGASVLKAEVADPLSGFFMIRRARLDAVASRLAPAGFKVLFDLIASQREPLRIVEIPYAFRKRGAGTSKLDRRVVLEFASLVTVKMARDLVSLRMVMFGMVGATGVVIHFGVLRLALSLGFDRAQALAAITAMSGNYLANNALTYRDRRLHGVRLALGYVKFCALCSLGLLANLAVSDLVYAHAPIWWLAGAVGVAVGAVWNYAATSMAVW